MTQQDAIHHWLHGAQEELDSARVLQKSGKYLQALFHCHLAVEKALKAKWIAERNAADVPHTHDLLRLAEELKQEWTEEQKTLLETMTRFVIDARYADPGRAEAYATRDHVQMWIGHAEHFLSLLSP